jgi:hypothetical protein
MPESLIGFVKILRNDLGFSEYRHEVGIPRPTGNKMDMKVTLSGPPRFSDVDSDVKSMRVQGLLQTGGGDREEMKKAPCLLPTEFLQVETMNIGNNHEMAIGIRKLIHHDKGLGSAEQDQVLAILLFQKFLAKEASRLFFLQDIIHSPWGPKKFHFLFLP